jgi:probable F420-dependent oxidoreductase
LSQEFEQRGLMKISVEFPSITYREGPARVAELARTIEAAGYNDIAMFDYVAIGYGTGGRAEPPYPAKSPMLEALTTLSFLAGVTTRVSLSTEVLVLPQRQALLVAKQASTVDTLSGGRLRLGVGVGWQMAEYEALGEQFRGRGSRMDEAIGLLRACWSEPQIDCSGQRFDARAIAMEPKPPQAGRLPIWIGGGSPAALRRAASVGDGWMVPILGSDELVRGAVAELHGQLEHHGRDPREFPMQGMLSPPPTDRAGRDFYRDLDRVVRRAEEAQAMGFSWISVNATAIFQAGARTTHEMAIVLGDLLPRLRDAIG